MLTKPSSTRKLEPQILNIETCYTEEKVLRIGQKLRDRYQSEQKKRNRRKIGLRVGETWGLYYKKLRILFTEKFTSSYITP